MKVIIFARRTFGVEKRGYFVHVHAVRLILVLLMPDSLIFPALMLYRSDSVTFRQSLLLIFECCIICIIVRRSIILSMTKTDRWHLISMRIMKRNVSQIIFFRHF
jgi:hypothetical protein